MFWIIITSKSDIMILLCLVIGIRVKEPVGEINYISTLDKYTLNRFTRKNGTNIVIFDDKCSERCIFANFALHYFHKKINFAISTESEGRGLKCSSFPCVIPFRNGSMIKSVSNPHLSSTKFAFWCQQLLNPLFTEIKYPEQLRLLLETPGSYVIGINHKIRPNNLPDDIMFYYSPRLFFGKLGIVVTDGVYVYRYSDRYLEQVNENFSDYLQSPISNLNSIDVKQKKFVVGYVFNRTNSHVDELEMNIMINLSKIYGNEAFFAPLNNEYIYGGNLQFFDLPIIAAFETDKPKDQRWVLNNEKAHDYNYVNNWLKEVISGKKSTFHLSENKPNQLHRLNYDNYQEIITSTHADALVLFSKDTSISRKLVLIIQNVIKLINSSKLDYFIYNLTTNDVPPNISLTGTLPILLLYPESRNDQPYLFGGEPNVKQVMQFVNELCTNKFIIPKYNYSDMTKLIEEELKSIK